MRLLLAFSIWMCATHALAQGAPELAPAAPDEIRIREPGSAFTWQPPPPVGTCLGGSCQAQPSAVAPVVADGPSYRPRMRFAYAGAVLGTVSAGLVLGSSIAIAKLDDFENERITRGVWVGYLAVSTSLVAISARLARGPGASGEASKATRRIGWTAFALALTDGIVLWAGSFRDFTNVDVLTIGAGAIGAVALLPHALDALVAARGLRVRQFGHLSPIANGLRVRF